MVPKITSCSHTQDTQSVHRQTQLKAMRGMLGVQSTPIRHMTQVPTTLWWRCCNVKMMTEMWTQKTSSCTLADSLLRDQA